MFARLVTMIALLAFAVVTTVASAHAADMSIGSGMDHANHVETMHAPDFENHACDGEQHCESADAGMCEFVCAGLSAFLSAPGGNAGRLHGRAIHDIPPEARHVGRAPELNERPPKLRLL